MAPGRQPRQLRDFLGGGQSAGAWRQASAARQHCRDGDRRLASRTARIARRPLAHQRLGTARERACRAPGPPPRWYVPARVRHRVGDAALVEHGGQAGKDGHRDIPLVATGPDTDRARGVAQRRHRIAERPCSPMSTTSKSCTPLPTCTSCGCGCHTSGERYRMSPARCTTGAPRGASRPRSSTPRRDRLTQDLGKTVARQVTQSLRPVANMRCGSGAAGDFGRRRAGPLWGAPLRTPSASLPPILRWRMEA